MILKSILLSLIIFLNIFAKLNEFSETYFCFAMAREKEHARESSDASILTERI